MLATDDEIWIYHGLFWAGGFYDISTIVGSKLVFCIILFVSITIYLIREYVNIVRLYLNL